MIPNDLLELRETEKLLFYEARLLDEGRLQEWLDLFTADAVYWVPSSFLEPDPDPTQTVSIIYDDKARMEERVWRIESGLAHAQNPPSATCHLLTNIDILASSGERRTVSSTFSIGEYRLGEIHQLFGRYEHELQCVEGSWMIAKKCVRLVNAEAPLDSLFLP